MGAVKVMSEVGPIVIGTTPLAVLALPAEEVYGTVKVAEPSVAPAVMVKLQVPDARVTDVSEDEMLVALPQVMS